LFGKSASVSTQSQIPVSMVSAPITSSGDSPRFSVLNRPGRSVTLGRMTGRLSCRNVLDKRRQSSLAVRRQQSRRNLPLRINKVWSCFAEYVLKQKELEKKQVINGDADDDGKDDDEASDGNESVHSLRSQSGSKSKSHSRSGSKSNSKSHSSFSSSHSSVESLENVVLESENNSTLNVSPRSQSDAYSVTISYPQFNIVLNDGGIAVKPDMAAALIWMLLEQNGMITEEQRTMGREEDNLHNDPMKERSFAAKQFKVITKCQLSYQMLSSFMERLNVLIAPQDKALHPSHLSYFQRNAVIWDKIFDHLANGTSFDVENEYLFGALSGSQLNSWTTTTSMLSSLSAHWQHRVQLMEHIDDRLNASTSNPNGNGDDFWFKDLKEHFMAVLSGWSVQLTDDRSGVAKTAVVLLPAVLSSILLSIEFPAVLFDREQVLEPMYDGILCLVKNRRLKDMADDAVESLVQCTDVFAEVATDLDDATLMELIVDILKIRSFPKHERHDKAREAITEAIAAVLYGIDHNIDSNFNQHQNANSNSNSAKKGGTKISATMQRAHLLEREHFVSALGDILKNGVTDRSESGRRRSFNLLKKLENEDDGKVLEQLLSRWDFTVQKKYENWKKLQQRSKKKKKNKRQKTVKRKKKKKKEKDNLKQKEKGNENGNEKEVALDSNADDGTK